MEEVTEVHLLGYVGSELVSEWMLVPELPAEGSGDL